ncbi:uncharacterized protein LOC132065102 [Lycium ferocissimum]|uniref:uncharacterized protein LOC132065102 n=1 Tax=Lycium ferocissimum TaxID=112874 RepID=UPI0028161FE5|nr:uncharacterized protein LOC132065102 [Lycium ferocissimum]
MGLSHCKALLPLSPVSIQHSKRKKKTLSHFSTLCSFLGFWLKFHFKIIILLQYQAWAFEAILAVQQLAKDPSLESSMPRMNKWLSAKPARKTNSNLANVDPPDQTRKENERDFRWNCLP